MKSPVGAKGSPISLDHCRKITQKSDTSIGRIDKPVNPTGFTLRELAFWGAMQGAVVLLVYRENEIKRLKKEVYELKKR